MANENHIADTGKKVRLIDANALKKKADMRGHCIRPLVTAFQMCVTVHDIDDAPTVDAVEVVRCKDCVYHEECVMEYVFLYSEGIENPYCCAGTRDGERKEEK